jgi:hypothetical protein
VVPRVEREEFVNAGVVVFCEAFDYLEAEVALDESRLCVLCPGADVTLVRRHLESFAQVCAGGARAGPVGALSQRERWRWLTAPRSTILQTSAAHAGLCVHPADELVRLVNVLVRPLPGLQAPRRAAGGASSSG